MTLALAGGAKVRAWRPAGGRRIGARALLLLALLTLLSLAPYVTTGTELVRLRHALTLGPPLNADFDWQPPGAAGAGYKQETLSAPPLFIEVARQLQLQNKSDDWQRVLSISSHLLGSAPALHGGAIQSDLLSTYRRIVNQGDGYCGDFVRAFQAISQAAGMTTRPWAFSFDGFGGHGHIWIEVWNRDRRQWQLVDIYNNRYYTRSDGQPLSALQLRTALLAGDPDLGSRQLVPGDRQAFEQESKLWDYIRRGLDQWYLVWGDNVLSQDAVAPASAGGPAFRALSQLSSIVQGVTPAIRPLPTPSNSRLVDALTRTRWHLLGVAGLVPLALLAAGVLALRQRLLAWRQDGGQAAPGQAIDAALTVCIVGPLPPPSGGMANQCEQLLRLMAGEPGMQVRLVRTNAPYRPGWIGHVPMVRALARLLPYLRQLWVEAGRADALHLFANSGWAWHLVAWPALLIGRWRGAGTIVNYRGGHADAFFSSAPRRVLRTLAAADLRVTPSAFLHRVFAKHGLDAQVIPNIVDLSRFRFQALRDVGDAPHLVVTRNLEAIYDIPTALRAFQRVRKVFPGARLTVAGSGPEQAVLQKLVADRGLSDCVRFSGRIDNAHIPELYAQADCMLNPSTVDNMPISILEAMACGVPVVSTDAGGIPDLVDSGRTGWLVPVGDDQAMAERALSVLRDRAQCARLVEAARAEVDRFAWPQVRSRWLAAYRQVARRQAWA